MFTDVRVGAGVETLPDFRGGIRSRCRGSVGEPSTGRRAIPLYAHPGKRQAVARKLHLARYGADQLIPKKEKKPKMKSKLICRSRLAIFAVALLVSPVLIVRAQSTSTDPLKSYTTCKVRGDLKIREVTRRNNTNNYREITADKGTQKVSVVDGYRVMFAYPDLPYYFANVKIEQSDPDSYAADKEILVNQLKYYQSIKEAHPMIFEDKKMLNDFEHYGIDRDKIDVGAQVGVHILFYDPAHLVVTIYFLNQSKAAFFNNRRYEDIKQYREIRDDFLNSYSECLKRVAGETKH